MSGPEDAQLTLQRARLETRIRAVDELLRSEMRARGFDPEQQDNLALTGPLAKLYMERENLRSELDLLSGMTGE